ncbi:MAG: ATP-binding protein [Cellulophaga sp.]
MEPKNILNHLSALESKLNDFSFEKLTAEEAHLLKKTFYSFKSSLEDKVEGTNSSKALRNNPDFFSKISDSSEVRKETFRESKIIATVSHEIRTPLNGIMGFADLLKETGLTKEQLFQVNAIQSASHNLLDVVNELLEYSNLSTGIEKFENVDFNFYNVIRNTLYLCDTLILDKNIKLEVDMDSDIPEVLVGDPSKLSQILLNILGNAIKFVEKGSIHLKVNLKKQKSSKLYVEFQIIDTGIGIAKDKLDYIFETYKQAENDTHIKYGGTGLGLSIVKQIIENLKGDITVSSVLGAGTTFKFILPFKKGNNTRLHKKTTVTISIEEKKTLVKGLNILVFEDNTLNQKLIENRLKSWKCNPFITDDATEGLTILETKKIDLILMDLKMPVMNGFQIAYKIRNHSNPILAKIQIIAVTADFSAEDQTKCNSSGINDYLLKPYSPEKLLDKLIENKKKAVMNSIQLEVISSKNNDKIFTSNIDLTPILIDCMGDVSLLEELIDLYKKNALEFIGKAKFALQNTDIKELKFASHKIKAGLSMMQTTGLYEIVEQMHRTCETNRDFNHLEFLYNCFLTEYPVVEKNINEAFTKIQLGNK